MVTSPAQPVEPSSADRLAFETLIADTSARLMAAAPSAVDAAVESALEQVRLFFGADRCGLLAVSADRHIVQPSHASYAPGAPQVPKSLNVVSLFPWAAVQVLEHRRPIVVPRVSALPPEAAVDRATFEALGTRAQMTVPIVSHSVVTHLMLLASVAEERDWPEILIPRLRLLGEMMVAAVQRAEVFAALQTSEERLTRTAAAAGCGLWELDPGSGEVWVTPLTRRLYGIAQDETVSYARFLELLHPEDRERVGVTHAEALGGDAAVEMEHRVVLPDGAVRWLQAFGQRGESGRLLGAAVDVTARVLADERAREEAMRVVAAVDTAEVAFSDSAPDGRTAFLDARMIGLLGLQPGDEQRMPDLWLSRIDAEHRPMVLARARQLEAGEIERATVEYRYQHPARGWIWLRHSTLRLTHSPGGPRLINAAQDITDRRGREEALGAAHEELKRLRDRLERENVYLRKQVAPSQATELVAGRSPAIRRALDMADQVAATNSTVLLVGETGTGKERFAEYIHRASPRRAHHMVRVNCSAIPSALIESELFGRERGAYTGALSKQIGRFELAQGSTLFLDEIGDLPMEVQVKLLRVLQERTIERLGSPTPVPVDVRIIAATNRDLEAAVSDGTFRADLYYRLNVFPIVVPPLRERTEDIPALVDVLVSELGDGVRKRFDGVEPACIEALTRYDWPGNVRELRNVLERAMILATGATLVVVLPPAPRPTVSLEQPDLPPSPSAVRDLRQVERAHIISVLEQTGWRIRGANAAAEVLDMKPTTLEARMARLGIRRPSASDRG
jgi:formate hydrogenlyase transcriptional activator